MTPIKNKKLTFIDLFAGCGGLSEGFLQSGNYKALAHVEWELPMVNTLRRRLVQKWKHELEDSEKRVVHFDIQKSKELICGKWTEESNIHYGKSNHPFVKENGLKGLVGDEKVDMIIGGPPCQAYSIAGRAQDSNSMKEDYRNFLFESFIEVVKAFSPQVFLFENVPGMLSAKPGNKPVTQRVFEAFDAAGYKIKNPDDLHEAVYTASDFGVPQKRRRVIIIGVRKGGDINFQELYKEIDLLANKEISKTVKESIGHLPPIFPLNMPIRHNGKNTSHFQNDTKYNIPFHEPRYHNPRDTKIFREWINKNMNSKSTLEKIAFYNDLLGKSSNHAKYRNLEWDKPSPTIVAHLYKDGLMFIHPDERQARSITVKEAALLQSFPEDYHFLGSQGVCFKMIGNAVPPGMAKSIALGISTKIKSLNKYESISCL